MRIVNSVDLHVRVVIIMVLILVSLTGSQRFHAGIAYASGVSCESLISLKLTNGRITAAEIDAEGDVYSARSGSANAGGSRAGGSSSVLQSIRDLNPLERFGYQD